MSLLIQAIPQWSVVYTTCFETMWPESGEKLNDFLGESQGLSVNLDRLCSLPHWRGSSLLARSPGAPGEGLRSTPHTPTQNSPHFSNNSRLPYTLFAGWRARDFHLLPLQDPCASRGTGVHQNHAPPTKQTQGSVPASVDKRQARSYMGVSVSQETMGRILV